MKEYKAKLNDGEGACVTCGRFKKCTLLIKNTGSSIYCSNYEIKYGCEWFYEKSKSEEEIDKYFR